MDCTEVQAVGFNTGNNRKENPEKIAIKENTPHPRSPIMQYIYYSPGDVNVMMMERFLKKARNP
jgi:hypothetical protein